MGGYFLYMILAIDPGPKLSGYVVSDGNKIISSGKVSLKVIKELPFKFEKVFIEVTDWPIQMAGESYRDTCIVIGRLQEFFHRSSFVTFIGRKEATRHFGLKNDSGVIKFLKEQGFKNLTKDAWQAALIYHYGRQ